MALIAEFSFPSESFALRETLPRFSDVVVDAGRIVAHSPDATMPCLWVAGDSIEAFGEAMADDPTVESVDTAGSFPRRALYHVRWTDDVKEFVAEIIDHEGVILQATANDDRWRVRFRFVTRDQFETFRSQFADVDPSLQLEQLYEQQFPHQRGGNVTSDQYRALTTAVQSGFFEVPRQSSIEDVADELGISHQAVSERLRRGTANLVRETLVEDPDDGIA